MDTQNDLFTDLPADQRAHARRTDPATSHAAAAGISADDIRSTQQEVLLLLLDAPAADHQLQERAEARGIVQSPSGLRTRRSELAELGLVEDTGERTERTPRHGPSTVWALTKRGRMLALHFRAERARA